jgi:hypothetical protein
MAAVELLKVFKFVFRPEFSVKIEILFILSLFSNDNVANMFHFRSGG